jgi:hypothetical protein
MSAIILLVSLITELLSSPHLAWERPRPLGFSMGLTLAIVFPIAHHKLPFVTKLEEILDGELRKNTSLHACMIQQCRKKVQMNISLRKMRKNKFL